MKRIFYFVAATFLLASCTTTSVLTTFDYQEASARNLEPEHTMLLTPLIADLEVSPEKIYYVEREAFAKFPVDDIMVKNMPEFKKIALSRAAKAHDADVLVGTIMDITTDNGQLVIAVSGYVAKYKNFRNATTKDTELIREAQIFRNDLGGAVVSSNRSNVVDVVEER